MRKQNPPLLNFFKKPSFFIKRVNKYIGIKDGEYKSYDLTILKKGLCQNDTRPSE